MSKPNSQLLKKAGFLICIFITTAYLIFAFLANSDSAQNFHQIDMDERVVADDVHAILRAKNFSNIIHEASGADHRYGRILWNTSALFSAIPERIWGEHGQLVATRMTQAGFLILSYWILSYAFVTNSLLRALALLVCIVLPSTPYYASAPKPEPLQLLFLSLFLRFALEKNYRFGAHWFFLGLAFGAKITTVTWIPVLMILGIRSPIFQFLSAANFYNALCTLGAFLGGFIVSEIWIITKGFGEFSAWLHDIRVNVAHGSDDQSVTWLVWLRHIVHDWTKIPAELMILVGILAFIVVLFSVFNLWVKHKFDWQAKYTKGFVLVGLGLSNLLPIIFTAKRLWHFYLHPSMVLLMVGLIVLLENLISMPEEKTKFFRIARATAFFCLLCLMVSTFLFAIPGSVNYFTALSKRSKEPVFQIRQKEISYVTKLTNELNEMAKSRIGILIDAQILLLGKRFESPMIKNIWQPFFSWSNAWHIIIARNANIDPDRLLPPPSSASYIFHRLSKEMYPLYVKKNGLPCSGSPCYDEISCALPDVRIYVREDLAPHIEPIIAKLNQNFKKE